MDENTLKISAKNLGTLALPGYCPKCFYVRLKMRFKLPFQTFPGIFSSIDSYSKKITWGHFAKYKKSPEWFSPFGTFKRAVPTPHHSRFYYTDQETGISLTGVPDDILEMEDGRFFIIDYKTARFTSGQDALLPIYRVQLNGYAYIFEQLGMGKVAGIGLCYYEPQGEAPVEGDIGEVLLQDGFHMPFKAHLKQIELDPQKTVLPLLKQVRQIWDRGQVPAAKERCRDCLHLEQVIKISSTNAER